MLYIYIQIKHMQIYACFACGLYVLFFMQKMCGFTTTTSLDFIPNQSAPMTCFRTSLG